MSMHQRTAEPTELNYHMVMAQLAGALWAAGHGAEAMQTLADLLPDKLPPPEEGPPVTVKALVPVIAGSGPLLWQ